MFAQFSANLYKLLSNEEYQLTEPHPPDITTATDWTMQKIEMSTLIHLYVLDYTTTNWSTVLENNTLKQTRAETLRGKIGQVAIVYLLVGGEKPDWLGAEEYFGQDMYSVFWHVNAGTGEISAPKGHPKKLFGLNTMVEKAYKGMDGTADMSQFGKIAAPLLPKHKYPIITGIIITINFVILGLMYWSGYPNDFWVPRDFGAIYPPWVFEYGQWWRLFTAMFVHFGFAHLGANTFGLLVFGTRVERYFGRAAFCAIYVFAGLLGSVFSIFISQGYSAGASGAVYALVGALLAYTRITKRSIDFINWYLMFMYIGVGIAMGFATPGIDNAAHVGGLLGGLVFGAVLAQFAKKQK